MLVISFTEILTMYKLGIGLENAYLPLNVFTFT